MLIKVEKRRTEQVHGALSVPEYYGASFHLFLSILWVWMIGFCVASRR